MEAPAITRHRRPFFAPLWLTMLAAVLVGGVAVSFYRSASTTVVLLVRPMEKEPGTIEDPPLSPEGEQRAQQLAQMLGDGTASLDAIYVSEDRRAEQTAVPLAQRVRRTPVKFSAAEARATASRVLREHSGGTVLVIGSGAALPQMIHELSGVDIGAASPGESILYIASVPSFGRAHLVRLRL
jgi:broad specificity phosphatase PhoE